MHHKTKHRFEALLALSILPASLILLAIFLNPRLTGLAAGNNTYIMERVIETEKTVYVDRPVPMFAEVNYSPSNWLNESSIHRLSDRSLRLQFGQPILLAGVKDSGSMRPTLDYTATTILIDYANQSLHPGDIIAYKLNDSYVLHRITKITKDGYVTRGDNNDIDDNPIRKGDIRYVLVGLLY